MSDIRSLIETAQTRGLRIFLSEGKVKIQTPQSLDENAKALIEQLREHREEIKALLSQPTLPCWNCGAKVAETIDIYGRSWWKCWECAVTI